MRFDSLQEWLNWQEGLNPKEISLGLERTRLVWSKLPRFQDSTTIITVAGTNGKGSSVAMLDAILQAAGYRTGCYTSPHLVHYNERIRINGQPLSDLQICRAFEHIDQVRGETPLTYFEYGTLAALYAFVDAAVDVAILEVGLGGRLDAVNVVDAHGVLITSIDLDHQQWLGNDRESIGREKAGVIRPGRPVVFSSEDPPCSVIDQAAALEAPLFVLGTDYEISVAGDGTWGWRCPTRTWPELPVPALEGAHQLRNAAGVVMLLHALEDRLLINRQALVQGLRSVQVTGRMQWLSGSVNWLLDVAHNPHAIEVLHHYLRDKRPEGKVRAVFGMLKGKDVAAVASTMDDLIDEWHLVDLSVDPRGLDATGLHQLMVNAQIGTSIEEHDSVRTALEVVMKHSTGDDLVLIFGSFHTVGEALRWREYNGAEFQPNNRRNP